MKQPSALLLLTILALAALPSAGQRAREEFALILQDPPVAAVIESRKDLHAAGAEDQRRQVLSRQAVLRTELESRGYQVTGAVQTLLNAVFVRASADRVEELRGLSGVKRVTSSPPAKLHMDRASGLVRAPQAWSRISGGVGNAGTGIKIGIIDTGIDQTHPAFQDPSLVTPPGYPMCAPADCAAYTNNKVIVARSYVSLVADGTAPTPWFDSRPDDISPRDRVGHGTANAMIAAGVTNTAPNGTTITGIAPKAFLGNYKIFGSPGVLDYTSGSAIIAAIEDAFLDGMDIVSLSLGSPAVYGPLDRGAACGSPDPNYLCDIRADAVESAVNGGMVVVASAGNVGDYAYYYPALNTVATPGTAPAAITVGATTNSHIFSNGLLLPGAGVPSNLQRIEAYFGDGPKPAAPLTAPLRDVQALGNDGLACTALTAGSLNGALALVKRGTCTFADKVNNAYAAGAVGAVIYMSDPDSFVVAAGLIATAIPAMTIGNDSGLALKSFLSTHLNHLATLDTFWTPTDVSFDDVASFSSRGPTIGQFGIKPELVAVGTDVFTATQNYDPNSDMYDAGRYAAFSGTSFSAPMVAGAAALVQQRNSAFTPADIKSALVNTASAGIGDPDVAATADVLAVGAGKLDVEAAVLSNVSAAPATLSFGNITTAWPPTPLKLKLKNLSALDAPPVTVTLGAPAPLTLSQTVVVLNPGAAATEVSVGLSGATPVAGAHQGFVTISGGAVPLRVPYLYTKTDSVVDNLIPLYGDGFVDIVGGFSPYSDQMAIKLVDRYGVPVPNIPVVFQPISGGGMIYSGDPRTDIYGIAAGNFRSGLQAGEQVFRATAGGLYWDFYGTAIPLPTVSASGVVNAASGELGQGLAPISYISIYGSGLSPVSLGFRTSYLPLSLAGVSVSFDTATLSFPGRIHYVSSNQINVEIPREFQGQNSVWMKVSIGDISTQPRLILLNNYSPALFEYPASSGYAVAMWNGAIVTTGNRVPRGQTVQLYVNGLGPVDQAIVTGDPTPASPQIQTTATPAVTVGGVQATVGFHGLVPGAIGLYRLDVTVPASAPTGDQDVIVTSGGVSSKAVKLPVQ